MRPTFEAYGVQVVALSKDPVPRARAHRQRDGLTFPLLCDPELQVIRQYGLLHRNGLQFRTLYLFGIPYGWPTGFRRMALPATLLVDEAGVVRWVDLAEDYRLRGDAARLEKGLATAFGPLPPGS